MESWQEKFMEAMESQDAVWMRFCGWNSYRMQIVGNACPPILMRSDTETGMPYYLFVGKQWIKMHLSRQEFADFIAYRMCHT